MLRGKVAGLGKFVQRLQHKLDCVVLQGAANDAAKQSSDKPMKKAT